MLTPRFKLTQDEDHVFIVVHAPYTNISETEIDVDGENFLFVSSPYFLRLRLPGKIIEDESSKGSYTCDSGEIKLSFNKQNPSEHFENLDMITSLLAPREIPDLNPNLIEVLQEEGITLANDNASDDDKPNVTLIHNFPYGFANKISSDFRDIGSEFPQIFELRVPERVSLEKRHSLRIQHENEKFSSDHYLADFYDDELLEPYLSANCFWEDSNFKKLVEFTDDEIAVLKDLPNKSYLLTKTEYKQVVIGILDILFGYCYDKRTTLNESTVESSWTINRLSATLSWFCMFGDLKQSLVTCYKRALIYPIFRNFELCNRVKKSLVALLKQGKILIIKCMIEIHQMFNSSNDARYILNQLYIKDYLVFLQKCRNQELDDLALNIANIEISKNCLDLDLEELEHAAELVQQDEMGIVENEMALKMASMNLLEGNERNARVLEKIIEDSDVSDSSTDSSSDSSSDDSSSELDSDDDVS